MVSELKADNENPVRMHSGKDFKPETKSFGSQILRFLGMFLKLIVPVAVLAGAYQTFHYLKATKPEVAQRPAREKVWPVKSLAIKFADYQPKIRLFGETVAGRQVELRALVGGEIVEGGQGLKEGAEVQKGDVLLKIDVFEYEGALTEARANLDEAKAKLKEIEATIALEKDGLERLKQQLDLAQKDLDRAIPLAEKGTVSKKLADDRRLVVIQRSQDVEQRENTLKVQTAKADQQRAIIKRLEWNVRRAERNVKQTVLKAPFDSYVSNVKSELGKMVGVNDSVATLIDRGRIDVRFSLSDKQYGRIVDSDETLVGKTIDVKWFVGDRPQTFVADVERVSAEISSEDGGVEVYARIRNPTDSPSIRTGAFVEVMIADKTYKQVVRLPRISVYDNDRIYVIKDQRLQERIIDVVGYADKDVLVKGPLETGERVLATKLSTAGDGVKVLDLSEDLPKAHSMEKGSGTKVTSGPNVLNKETGLPHKGVRSGAWQRGEAAVAEERSPLAKGP